MTEPISAFSADDILQDVEHPAFKANAGCLIKAVSGISETRYFQSASKTTRYRACPDSKWAIA